MLSMSILKLFSKLQLNSNVNKTMFRGLAINYLRNTGVQNVLGRKIEVGKRWKTWAIGYRNYTNKSDLIANLDSDNVLHSSYPDMKKFQGIYVHDFVWENLYRYSNKTALVCAVTGKSYTYAQLRKACGKFATFLRKNNVRPGDTIAAVLPNIPEYAIVLLGSSEAGVQITIVNPSYTANEINRQLTDVKAKAVVTTSSKYSLVKRSIAAGVPSIKLTTIVVEDDAPDSVLSGTIKFEDTIGDGIEEFEKSGEKTGIDSEDTFILPYSSGTSGLPKGVELSHRNIVANLMQSHIGCCSIIEEATATHQEVLPLILPVYHIYGLVACLKHYLCLGGKIICVPQLTKDRLFQVFEEHRCTMLYAVPPIIQIMSNDPRLKPRHLERVKRLVSGAAPIGNEALTLFLSRTQADLKIVQGYGMTECSPVISVDLNGPMSTVGRVVANTAIRIVPRNSESDEIINLGTGQVGEILVKGPQVMKGYYNNPQATADTMNGDWFKTGDLAAFDKHGYLYIKGRLKELIKVHGHQVAPAELEDLMIGHDKIADVGIIGVPNEKYGEVPKAFVVMNKNAKMGADELKDWVAERVVKYKRLGHVVFVDKIPKSAAGKILRNELAKM